MVRLKFLLFALLVLGLGLAHLPLLSGPLSAHVVEGATAQAGAAISEVARTLDVRRAAIQGLALKLASSQELALSLQPLLGQLSKKGKGPRVLEPLTAERFGAARSALEAALPEELKPVAVFALVTEGQAWYAQLGGEASQDTKVLDARALVRADAEGTIAEAFGTPYYFVSVPVLWLNETVLKGPTPAPRLLATLVVGAPLVVDGMLPNAASNSGVAALALIKGGSVIGTAGTDKPLAELARTQLQSGESDVIQRGEVQTLLEQLRLPLFTEADDLQGGRAALAVGVRRSLRDTPFEVVSVVSVRPFMRALADYQQSALLALAGLLGFSLVWTLVMGIGLGERSRAPDREQEDEQEGSESQTAPAPEPGSEPAAGIQPEDETTRPTSIAVPRETGAQLPLQSLQQEPSAEADDFPFPASAGSGPFKMPAASEPFASATAADMPFSPAAEPAASSPLPFEPPPSMPDSPAQASLRRSAYAFEDQPTAAYSSDPFLAAAQAGFGEAGEATRVAAIPPELLQATARPLEPAASAGSGPFSAPKPATPQASNSGVFASPSSGNTGAFAIAEEQHFQEVFREFVATRERCGEPNDGLTYEKFVGKLRKNKEQLLQRYACRTVRFQVYVKEGKAALKATPVKD